MWPADTQTQDLFSVDAVTLSNITGTPITPRLGVRNFIASRPATVLADLWNCGGRGSFVLSGPTSFFFRATAFGQPPETLAAGSAGHGCVLPRLLVHHRLHSQ